jgi:hypothetical protein
MQLGKLAQEEMKGKMQLSDKKEYANKRRMVSKWGRLLYMALEVPREQHARPLPHNAY